MVVVAVVDVGEDYEDDVVVVVVVFAGQRLRSRPDPFFVPPLPRLEHPATLQRRDSSARAALSF